MQLIGPPDAPVADEFELLSANLPLDGARILELGCGAAATTRQIAERTLVREIVAAEVDQTQHQLNLQVDDLPRVQFESFGAESIDAPEGAFDLVLMFKSLHHVPVDVMDCAMDEIHRVLRPGGYLWVSEPVFDGDFNEVIRLFHDEQVVRQAAFSALQRAVDRGLFALTDEMFFRTPVHMKSFDQFEASILSVTYNDYQIDDALLRTIRERFEAHRGPDGYRFENVPNRVDLLRRT